MESNSSISYILPNLLIGLCKGSSLLAPYSNTFHDQLGYEFFRLELSFPLSTGRTVNPDAILISPKVGNTLLFEWTETNDSSLKKEQLNRYAQIKGSDLTNIAAVPPIATQSYDVVLTLRPTAVESFLFLFNDNDLSFPILTLEQQDQIIVLTKTANTFQVKPTDKFFTEGIQVDRIPHYLPFSLETCQAKEMVPLVIQHLVSLLVREESIISLPDFCKGLIPAWSFIAIRKQKELSGIAKDLLNDLNRKRWCAQLTKRIGDNPPTWQLSPESFKKNPKGFRKLFNEFVSEVREDTYQPGLDFSPDIE